MKYTTIFHSRGVTLFLTTLVSISFFAGCSSGGNLDATAPTITTPPAVGVANDTTITVTIAANEEGKVFWILYPVDIVPPYSNGDAFVDAAKGETAGIKRSGKEGVSTTASLLTTITIKGLTPETAYDFYAVVEDPAGNPSAISEKVSVITTATPDTTAPVITTQPMLSGEAEDTSITVTITANEGGSIFWILYSENNAPDSSNSRDFINAVKSGTASVKRSEEAGIPITANTPATISITQLTPETAYDFYAVVEDTAGNPSLLSNKLDVLTIPTPDTTAPIIITQPMVDTANDTNVTVTITANEGGRIFWILYPAGTIPLYSNSSAFIDAAKGGTAGVKTSGEAGLPIIADTTATISIDTLTPETAYDFYAVVEDAAGNPSVISNKLDVTTTATPDIIAPMITAQPMLGSEAEDTSIAVTITANEGGRIFWILYEGYRSNIQQ